VLTATANPAPTNSAITKAGPLDGAMPANLSLNMRPNAAAGFANDVEAVNKYATPMKAAIVLAALIP
jgi:hypothetical protein